VSDAHALDADHYDEMWRKLEDFLRYNPGARHRRRLVRDALRRHSGSDLEVLDVGCGLGEMLAFLAAELPQSRFTGVDFSGGAIESCRRRFPQHRWEVADVVTDDLPGPFDTVVCSELLEHLDEPKLALEHIATSLKPGGTIVVTVPNGKVFKTERAVGHVTHPTVAALREWFDAAGLEVVEARRWGWPGYLALKYAANVDADRALSALGSGEYSWLIRRANDLAYLLVGASSLRDHRRGPETVIVGRRRAGVGPYH
jgi:2-polyprenyl-3-methyl-5-hydroxy-6-metoxy-1,4-benzoquinol methylase